MPPDGQLASAGIANYSQLDKQSLNAWTKSPMTAGPHGFVWYHTRRTKPPTGVTTSPNKTGIE